MMRFLTATLAVACLAPFVFAEEVRVYDPVNRQPKSGVPNEEPQEKLLDLDSSDVERQEAMCRRYLDLAKQRAEILPEEELRQEIERLAQQQAELEESLRMKKLADDIEKRLTDVAEYLEHLSGYNNEAATIARQIRKNVLGDIATIRKWKAGTLEVPDPGVPVPASR